METINKQNFKTTIIPNEKIVYGAWSNNKYRAGSTNVKNIKLYNGGKRYDKNSSLWFIKSINPLVIAYKEDDSIILVDSPFTNNQSNNDELKKCFDGNI